MTRAEKIAEAERAYYAAMIAAGEAYTAATRPAWEEYNRTIVQPAFVARQQAERAALDAYRAVLASAVDD